LIFNPGFSTAKIITDISGRGVGMNVVKEIVNELNGNIRIETEPGMGTRFIMSFPLTLAIIPAIMVKVAKEMYAIPLSDVTETIKISESDITTIEGHEVINLRGEILSLLRLNEFIRIESFLQDSKKIPVVIVGYGNRKIGLLVDFLEGKQEIVIKSLEQNYTTVEGLAGASILGDGSICLILDISSMMNRVISDQELLSRRNRQRIAEVRTRVEPEAAEAAGEVTTVEVPSGGIRADEQRVEVKTGEPTVPAEEMKGGEVVKEDIIYERDDKRDVETEDVEIRKSVKEALNGFREELKESIRTTVDHVEPDEHVKRALQITSDDIERMQILANTGIANAAESLSKILNKRIGLSIPEIRVLPLERIPESIGEIDSVYIGVYMPLIGGIRGTILFSLVEDSGYELIRLLYETEGRKIKELDEDGESALIEVTNIVGSSIVNVFSEKIKMALKPTVPTLVHDYMQSILDSILIMHNISNDYALIMSTEFYYQDDTIMGNLLVLPEIDSLKLIMDKLRE
jgi:two-component system chemotaxis sensor kinase CheA